GGWTHAFTRKVVESRSGRSNLRGGWTHAFTRKVVESRSGRSNLLNHDEITNDIKNGAGPSGGGGGDAIPHGIHVWIERFTKLKPLAFWSDATPVEAKD
nr:hypothetical protein [Tanacetum cinerariifolium]